MTSVRKCTRCGATVPGERPTCPRCLLALAAAPAPPVPEAEASAPRPAGRAPAPTPAELAADFPQLEILERVGEGGMGVVYRARHRQLGREVALKILAPGAEQDERFADRFLAEARALARLDHPGIVRVFDFGRAQGRWFLSMEFVPGTNLRAMLRAGPIEPRAALAIVRELCDALQYAHDEGIVHRDIKPENVLVDSKGRVRLADFGLAKLLETRESGPRLTAASAVMGTPHYMAPEQARSSADVDHRADIYSLGVVFYEMLTGELPLGRFEPPSRRVSVDVRLDEIVLKTLEREPARRYQHAVDVRTDVEGIGPSGAADAGPGQAAAPPAADEGTAAGSLWILGGWLVRSLVLWTIFWSGFGHWSAWLALPALALSTVYFVHRGSSVRLAPWRGWAAAPLWLLGCGAWVLNVLAKWEWTTADYHAPSHVAAWISQGPRRALALFAEAGDASAWKAELSTWTHLNHVPALEYSHWDLAALLCWIAAALVLFLDAKRLGWRELGQPVLVLVSVTVLTAWCAAERVPLGMKPRLELGARADSRTGMEPLREAALDFAQRNDLDSVLEFQWKIGARGQADPAGRALLLVFEAQSPLRRWSFDVLSGPQRALPRVSILLVERTQASGLPGGENCAVEWSFGAAATEPPERLKRWRALEADLKVALGAP
jgi:predicted Ser/Thr protein kinase